MKPLNVALLGAGGRMGRAVLESARQHPDVRISAAVVKADSPLIDQEVDGVRFSTDLRQALGQSDVLLDFSLPASTADAIVACEAAGKPLVVGVTGLGPELESRLASAARVIPVLVAPNMSLGIALLTRLVRTASGLLGDNFDVQILETHHRHKKDAPSGTALALARTITKGRVAKARNREIGFASVRAGDIVGEHTVLFAGAGERLELTHRAADRTIFADGALRAVRWIANRPPGLYGLEDILGDG